MLWCHGLRPLFTWAMPAGTSSGMCCRVIIASGAGYPPGVTFVKHHRMNDKILKRACPRGFRRMQAVSERNSRPSVMTWLP